MTRILRTTVLVALIVAISAGGVGTAVAEETEINSGCTTVVNDDDLVDVDDSLNNISANVLGVQVDDSNADILSS
ncbi:hypothetical protein [Halocatena halophila]|uniref:hypothetical protein n=1 Tax=Halocatena halophila TaxID=2814576 RepID=UPI002ED31914